jgi:hypothetical protein
MVMVVTLWVKLAFTRRAFIIAIQVLGNRHFGFTIATKYCLGIILTF